MDIVLCALLAAIFTALNASAQSDWCKTHKARDIYSKETLGEHFLPEGGIRMVDFAFDNNGNWFVAGEEMTTGLYKAWRVAYSAKKTDLVFDGRAESIDVYYQRADATFVFAIVDNEIRMYGTPGNRVPPLEGEYKVIQRADDRYEFTGLTFDRSAHFLFVSDKKNNQVYRYDPSTPGYARRTAAGNRDRRAIDDETHLYHPLAVKYAKGDLYILQGPIENARLVRWTPFKSNRTFQYDFIVEGRLGFDVADVTQDYIYYRTHGDSVYKHCANWPCNDPILIAGGCGPSHEPNQLVNSGTGTLRMDRAGRLMIWDFGGERFVRWDNRALQCPTFPCPPFTTTTRVPLTTTTTTPTTTTSTTTTTTSRTTTSTTTTTSSRTSTSTTTTTTSMTTTSTTTTTSPRTTTSTTTTAKPTTSTTTTTTTVTTTRSDWCKTHKARDIYSKETLGEHFLPEGGIRMVDFAFDNNGNWFVAGEEMTTGLYKAWRVAYSAKKTDLVFGGRAESIDVYYQRADATFVFAIVDNEIRMYGTPGNRVPPLEGEYKVIQRADDRYEFTGLTFDRSAHFLFVSDKKNNQVYRYDPSTPGYARRTAAGNRDRRAIDDETHLYHPLAVKYAKGDLYILQGPIENARLVRWTPFKSNRTFQYDFIVEGRLGFDVADVTQDYIYYRTHGDSVYKHCANWPCNDPILIAGGCGPSHEPNQLVNSGTGTLRMDLAGRLMIWDFGAERFVRWDNRALQCPTFPCPPFTTTTRVPLTTTTTTPTTTTSTTTTTTSRTTTSTTTTTSPRTTTSTTTTTTSRTTTSTTTTTTSRTTTSTTTTTTSRTTTSTTTTTTSRTTTSTTTTTTSRTTTSTTTTTTSRTTTSTTTTTKPTTSTTTTTTTVTTTRSDWCKTHKARDIYSKETLGEHFLPEGGMRMVDFAFDNNGNWFVAGEEMTTGLYKAWRVAYSAKKTDLVFDGRAESIDVYYQRADATFVFAIVDNEIRMYGTPGNRVPPLEGEYKVIQRADDRYEFTGLTFDRSAHFLFVSDKKNNQVYRYDPSTPGYARRTAAGNRDRRAIDDETHLYHPLAVKYAKGDLYILQGPIENARLVRWTPFKSNRTFQYDFIVEGRLGFDVADVTQDYIYYRTHGDSVYKHCANWPCNDPILIAGGCGPSHEPNQLVNSGTGTLRMDLAGRLMIWDFGGERFVRWDNRALQCPTFPCPPFTTTTRVPLTTTTTTPTTTTSTTTTTTPRTTPSTTTTTTSRTTTSTTTTTTSRTTPSTTTTTTPRTTTSTTTTTTSRTTTSTTTTTSSRTTTSTTTTTTSRTTTSTTTTTTSRTTTSTTTTTSSRTTTSTTTTTTSRTTTSTTTTTSPRTTTSTTTTTSSRTITSTTTTTTSRTTTSTTTTTSSRTTTSTTTTTSPRTTTSTTTTTTSRTTTSTTTTTSSRTTTSTTTTSSPRTTTRTTTTTTSRTTTSTTTTTTSRTTTSTTTTTSSRTTTSTTTTTASRTVTSTTTTTPTGCPTTPTTTTPTGCPTTTTTTPTGCPTTTTTTTPTGCPTTTTTTSRTTTSTTTTTSSRTTTSTTTTTASRTVTSTTTTTPTGCPTTPTTTTPTGCPTTTTTTTPTGCPTTTTTTPTGCPTTTTTTTPTGCPTTTTTTSRTTASTTTTTTSRTTTSTTTTTTSRTVTSTTTTTPTGCPTTTTTTTPTGCPTTTTPTGCPTTTTTTTPTGSPTTTTTTSRTTTSTTTTTSSRTTTSTTTTTASRTVTSTTTTTPTGCPTTPTTTTPTGCPTTTTTTPTGCPITTTTTPTGCPTTTTTTTPTGCPTTTTTTPTGCPTTTTTTTPTGCPTTTTTTSRTTASTTTTTTSRTTTSTTTTTTSRTVTSTTTTTPTGCPTTTTTTTPTGCPTTTTPTGCPTTTTTTTPTGSPTTATTTTQSTTSSGSLDCKIGDAHCRKFHKGSYCKAWLNPKVCYATDIPCWCEQSTSSTTPAATTSPTTSNITTTSTTATTTMTSTETCDAFCNKRSRGSYCKYWLHPSVCHGIDIPCPCG